jgi:cardiolipin synthase
MARKKTAKLLAGYTHHNKVRLVHGGADFFATIEQLIDGARYTIHLQTYIFDADETGKRVSDALLRAVAEGWKSLFSWMAMRRSIFPNT